MTYMYTIQEVLPNFLLLERMEMSKGGREGDACVCVCGACVCVCLLY